MIVAGLPSFIVTVGRPFFGATALPSASSRIFEADTRSTTKTTGSSAPTPSSALPWAPKASLGVAVMRTREPTFLPGSWLRNDPNSSGAARSRPTAPDAHVLWATLPSVPLTMTAWIETRSSLATVAPSPWVRTEDSVVVTFSGASTVTVGPFLGSEPSTETALSAADREGGASSPHALSRRAEARTEAERTVGRRRDTGANLRSGRCGCSGQVSHPR